MIEGNVFNVRALYYTKNIKHQQMHQGFFFITCNTLLHVSTLLDQNLFVHLLVFNVFCRIESLSAEFYSGYLQSMRRVLRSSVRVM
jgi:hypothetical protein